MASGEHVVEDLFGFAELTGEARSPAIDAADISHLIVKTKLEDSTKFHFEKEKIKRDTDEVVVPIFFEKSGVKKYKVLARHQVEDDEDIKRPVCSDRQSPNSEEQRKENINIEGKNENVQKQKIDTKVNLKKTRMKRIEKGSEGSTKNLKQTTSTKKFKGKFCKIRHWKSDEKKSRYFEQKKKKESFMAKDPKAVNYEFHDDSDSNKEPHNIKAEVEDEVCSENSTSCPTSAVNEENSATLNLETAQIVQNPLKIQCHVKLRRDPSIENFYKTKSDNDGKDSNESDNINCDLKIGSSSAETTCECTKAEKTYDKAVNIQSSSEDCLMKVHSMVYNVGIQVRKSGRLQSAKCASRYRGDYGIRVDTYKQLMNKTVKTTSCNSYNADSDEKHRNSKREDSSEFSKEYVREENVTGLKQRKNGKIETVIDDKDKQIKNEEVEMVSSKVSGNESLLNSAKYSDFETECNNVKKIEEVVCVNNGNIPTDFCKFDTSSEQFTLLKEQLTNSCKTDCSSKSESCSKTECLIETCFEDSCNKDAETKSQAGQKANSDRILLKSNIADHHVVEVQLNENKVSKIDTEYHDNSESCSIELERSECVQSSHRESNDKHGYKTDKELDECDQKMMKTENDEITDKVPCCSVIDGKETCTCDTEIENNTLQHVKSTCSEQSDSEARSLERKEVMACPVANAESETCTTKDSVADTQMLQRNSMEIIKESTGYVHSVGKSVNKMEKRIKIKKPPCKLIPEHAECEISPESTPAKDPSEVLKSLRQKLFESAGADLLEADKVPKQFESKLISSRQRMYEDGKSSGAIDLQEIDKQIRDSESTSGRSGKSTPRCMTPRQEFSTDILEEVAMSLGVLHQAKRRLENSNKVGPSKRQRFEDKAFLLRSMIKKTDDVDITVRAVKEGIEDEEHVIPNRIGEKSRPSRSSAESSNSKSGKNSGKSNIETSDMKCGKKNTLQDKPIQKPKPVKCSACSHIFKTKELLRKHFPCRIRQTRTWSQNKLRPNRAVKRIENCTKMFVCKLPKNTKPESSKPRPQLLTYRKTKFRRVKGKRRRKLYQLIQELRQRRMPVKWPHLSIVYDDLSFKEQCLYKLGLICVGHASAGLERYTADEITVFEQHRAKEKWLMEDAQTFEHFTPDTLETLTNLNVSTSDLNTSTDLSTDNQESDILSPKHVIALPQENSQKRHCDIDDISNDAEGDGTIIRTSAVEIYKKDSTHSRDFSPNISESKESFDKKESLRYTFYPGVDEKETDTSYEEIADIAELPEKIKADISIQEYLEFFRSSKSKTDSDNNVMYADVEITDAKSSPRSHDIVQLETFTALEEGEKNLEETIELSENSGKVISVKEKVVDTLLRMANITEFDVRTTDLHHINKTNTNEDLGLPSSAKCSGLNHQVLNKNENKDYSTASVGSDFLITSECTCLPCDHSNEKGSDFNINTKNKKIEIIDGQHVCSESADDMVIEGSEFDKKTTYIGNRRAGTDDKSVCEVKSQQDMKKFSSRKYFAIAPDIELYHQTANIDDELLADTPLAVQHEKHFGKDTQITHVNRKLEHEILKTEDFTTSTSDVNVDPDALFQASGILKDILGDVEKSINESKDKFEPEFDNCAAIDNADITNVKQETAFSNMKLHISPLKGILKNGSPRKECSASPQLEVKTEMSNDEIIEKTSGKRKIDFKTYAKRKGMIKDKEKNSKECIQSEPCHEIEDKETCKISLETEGNKECLRSEPNHEIEDGLLGRLLDAVNLIDSIIEEHKCQSGSEEEDDDDTFNAITPEMAFEAAILNKKDDDICVVAVSKPYDIESVYSYWEDEKVITEEQHFTEKKTISENYEHEFKELSADNAHYVSTEENVLLEKYVDNEEVKDSTESCKETLMQPRNENRYDSIKQFQQIATESRLEHKLSENFARNVFKEINPAILKECKNEYELCLKEEVWDQESTASRRKVHPVSEEIDPELEFSNLEGSVVENPDQEILNKNDGYIYETSDVKSKELVQEEADMEEINKTYDDNEMMKSPQHIPKKRMKRADDATSLKESNVDFTIKYEMNGVVVKENLLTGDKNLVENSSPFRSSAESDGYFDQSSLSEIDVSSVPDSEKSYSGNEAETSASACEESSTYTSGNISYFSDQIESNSVLSKNVDEQTETNGIDINFHRSNGSIFPVEPEKSDTDDFDKDCDMKDQESDFCHEIGDQSNVRNDAKLFVERAELVEDIQEVAIDVNSIKVSISSSPVNKESLNADKAATVIEEHVSDTGGLKETFELRTDAKIGNEDMFGGCFEQKIIDVSDDFEEEMSPENVPCLEIEPVLEADNHVLRKVSDDNSVGSPPILEKVEISDGSQDEQQDEGNAYQETTRTTDGEPPLLEPQLKNKETKNDQPEAGNIGRQERHFLDVLGIVSYETSDSPIFPEFLNKTEDFSETCSKISEKHYLEDPFCEDARLNESIGRHFSDVMNDSVEVPRTPKSKLQLLFDESEMGEVTLAQIKDILSPFSKKGKKRKSIPKESLLKIKAGIADLLSNVKKPKTIDPIWLKRDAFSDYSRNNTQKKLKNDEKVNDAVKTYDESTSLSERNVFTSSDSLESTDLCISRVNNDAGIKNLSKGSISDTIMQMLDSLEDNGSVAINMSKLLDILAENLGLLGERKENELLQDSSSDSDYSYSEEVSIPYISSTENSQKELIADYLEEGEQPPSLDDIPIANNFQMSWKQDLMDTTKSDEKSFIETEGDEGLSRQCGIKSFESKMEESGKNTKHSEDTDDFEEQISVATAFIKDEKRKATTIFKSITELNSIETDEESSADEAFDPVSMSARLSELKDTNTWEFNSDYESDREKSDNIDSEFETDVENEVEIQDNIVLTEDNVAKRDQSKDRVGQESFVVAGHRVLNKKSPSLKNEDIDSQVHPIGTFPSVSYDLVQGTDKVWESEKGHLCAVTSEESADKTNFNQVEEQVSESSLPDDCNESATEHNIDKKMLSNMSSSKRISDDSSISLSVDCSIANSGLDKKYTSFVKKIEEAAILFKHEAEILDHTTCKEQENKIDVTGFDSQSFNDIREQHSDKEDETSLREHFSSDSCHSADAEPNRIKETAITSERLNVTGDEVLSKGTEFTNYNHNKKVTKHSDDFVLTGKEDLQGKKETDTGYTQSKNLHLNDENVYENNYLNDATVSNILSELPLSEDDDTSETVTYDEIEGSKTDFSFSVNGTSDTNEGMHRAATGLHISANVKKLAVENLNSQDTSLLRKRDKSSRSISPIEKDTVSALKDQEGNFEGSSLETGLKETDMLRYSQLNYTSEKIIRDEHLNKGSSSSFHIDDNEYGNNFCESIAEKVKRKQREGSRSVCYSFNPWLYYSAAYVREVTKPIKKEISVFRSSILEKRAREKSFSTEKDEIDCSARKKRNSSVPKEAIIESIHERTYSDVSTEPKQSFQVKPCSVAIPKLSEDIIHRYTKRKRKGEEETLSENRPPIKVTIKLSQIVYPPNSPYGSTSTSSENYRSGYDSCSEESDIDTNEDVEENELEVEKQGGYIKSCYADDVDYIARHAETSLKSKVSDREPLKIKMRTLLTKMSSGEDVEENIPKSEQEIDPIKQFSGSYNESSIETDPEICTAELIESEVLHDIEQECEKVKSKELDVMFYLSESDDDEEEDDEAISGKQRHQVVKANRENGQDFGSRAVSCSSIKAECGESDVDLSDSDTDSEIQEKIDKILNSKGSVDFSPDLKENDDEDASNKKMKKGRSSLMRMIVSDLRLSESESEPEAENKSQPDKKAIPGEKIAKNAFESDIKQTYDVHELEMQKMSNKKSSHISENSSNSKIIEGSSLQILQSEETNLWLGKSALSKECPLESNVSDEIFQCMTKDMFSSNSFAKGESVQESAGSAKKCDSCDEDVYSTISSMVDQSMNELTVSTCKHHVSPRMSYVTERIDQDPLYATVADAEDNSLMQIQADCQDEDSNSLQLDDKVPDNEAVIVLDSAGSEPLDLSLSSKESVGSSSFPDKKLSDLPREVMRASSIDTLEKKFPIENLPFLSSETEKQENVANNMKYQLPLCDVENNEFKDMVIAQSQHHVNTARNLDVTENTLELMHTTDNNSQTFDKEADTLQHVQEVSTSQNLNAHVNAFQNLVNQDNDSQIVDISKDNLNRSENKAVLHDQCKDDTPVLEKRVECQVYTDSGGSAMEITSDNSVNIESGNCLNKENFVSENSEILVSESNKMYVTENTDISETENTEISLTDNTEISSTENTEISVTENNKISMSEDTEVPVSEKNEIYVSENTETSLTENTEMSVSENSEISVSEEISFGSTDMSEDETKTLENLNAVKNLKEDVFHNVQPIQNCSGESMVYYAVELSDELETNEAVVNLETVELIEGPIIIENNDTHEENILDTTILQSHVNDQFALSNETLNEQIVETLDEVKISSEVRVLESMTQSESQTFFSSVSEVKSKYLYGINEDSQSSSEVVEELVTEIVNDNTVIQVEGQEIVENQQIHAFSEESSACIRDNNTNVVSASIENSQYISEHFQEDKYKSVPASVNNIQHISKNFYPSEKITSVTVVSDKNPQDFSESLLAGDDLSRVVPVNIEKLQMTHNSSFNRNQEMMQGQDKVNKVTDYIETEVGTKTDTDANDSLDFECMRDRQWDRWTDRDSKSLPSNISGNNIDTSRMCSHQNTVIQFKSDNLSQGNDLIANLTALTESSELDQNVMCFQSGHIDSFRPTFGSSGNSFVQGFDNCGMVVDHCDENDYIITQNENFDDDDDDDVDEMEIA